MSQNISFFIMRKHHLALLTGVNSSYESITAVSGGNDNFTKKQTVKSFVSHRCQRWRKKSAPLFCGKSCRKMLLPTDSKWKSCDHLYRRHLFSWASWGLQDEGSKSLHDSPVDFHIPKKERKKIYIKIVAASLLYNNFRTSTCRLNQSEKLRGCLIN